MWHLYVSCPVFVCRKRAADSGVLKEGGEKHNSGM